MNLLIKNLLDFSRAGKAELQLQKLDMRAIVNSVMNDCISEIEKYHSKIIVNDLPSTAGDPVLIKQVWVNLLTNAIKYSSKKEQPEITISGVADNNTVTYSVADNGAGFDMKNSQHLFGVFQRLHSQAEFEGTGIGLSIAQTIISRHGGTIAAEAKPGEGAVFNFTLPS
jgi:two-component system sensor histidine kinase/response regulator